MTEPLAYPYPELGNGASCDLGRGVRWVRLPLPFKPGHVNVYRFEDAQGAVLVDCGFGDEETTACWERLAARPPADRVVVTHFHPDHIGQAARFAAAGACIYLSRPELKAARELHALSGENMRASFAEFFAANGLDVPDTGGRGNRYRAGVPDLPVSAEPLADGPLAFAPSWRAAFAGGHSPAHALLYKGEPPTIIAGDILLPDITPNISVWPSAPDADPLGDYLAALRGLSKLPEATLVLPAHGLPYRGLQARIAALETHHERRLDLLRRTAARGGAFTAAAALRVLFRRDLGPSSLPFALGESVAHLNHLWRRGELSKRRDGDGVYRYCARRRAARPQAGSPGK